MHSGRKTQSVFSVEDMLADLALAILSQGDYIWLTAGRSAAQAFIGFDIPENEDSLSRMSSAKYKFRVENFIIAETFEEAYNYAFQNDKESILDFEMLPRLRAFVSHIPQDEIYPLLEEQPAQWRHIGRLCRDTVDAAFARWKLEVDRRGFFSLREIALLSKEEYRSILASVRGRKLKVDPNSKPMMVGYDEAKIWLSSGLISQAANVPPKAFSVSMTG